MDKIFTSYDKSQELGDLESMPVKHLRQTDIYKAINHGINVTLPRVLNDASVCSLQTLQAQDF